jgi:hypothetical protein
LPEIAPGLHRAFPGGHFPAALVVAAVGMIRGGKRLHDQPNKAEHDDRNNKHNEADGACIVQDWCL